MVSTIDELSDYVKKQLSLQAHLDRVNELLQECHKQPDLTDIGQLSSKFDQLEAKHHQEQEKSDLESDRLTSRLLLIQLAGEPSLPTTLKAIQEHKLTIDTLLEHRKTRLGYLRSCALASSSDPKRIFRSMFKATRDTFHPSIVQAGIAYSMDDIRVHRSLGQFVCWWMALFVEACAGCISGARDVVEISVLWTQLSILNRSLSKVGAGFLVLLEGSFIDKAVGLVTVPLSRAVANYTQVYFSVYRDGIQTLMDRMTLKDPKVYSDDESLPMNLLNFPALAALYNSFVDAFNTTRQFPHPMVVSLCIEYVKRELGELDRMHEVENECSKGYKEKFRPSMDRAILAYQH